MANRWAALVLKCQQDYPLPTAVFSYVGRESGQNLWLGAGRSASETEKILADLRFHLVVAPEFRDVVQRALQPGDTLCLVSYPVLPRTGAASPVE